MEQQIIDAAINIVQPVLESAMVLAAEYSKACDRTFVTAMDVKYAMRYCAMNMVGKHIGTLFPEIYEEESDSEEDLEIVEEEEDDFTRYDGENELYLRVNESYDTWDEWNPSNPMEKMLKEAVDNHN